LRQSRDEQYDATQWRKCVCFQHQVARRHGLIVDVLLLNSLVATAYETLAS
jgi:hypothetical protein